MKNKKIAFYYRLILSIIIWVGLILSLYSKLLIGISEGKIVITIINYFSFFTIQSNIMVGIYFTLATIYTFKDKELFIFKPYKRCFHTIYYNNRISIWLNVS